MINQRKYIFLGALIGFSAICIYIWPVFFTVVLFLVWFVVVILSGLASAIWVHIKLVSPLDGMERTKQTLAKAENFRNKIIKHYECRVLREEQEREKSLPPIFGRTVDVLFQQLLDFVIRDHIAIHLKDLVYDTGSIEINIKKDLWHGIRKLHHRLSRIDHAKLIACDIVTVITHHFEKIRETKMTSDSDKPPDFELAPHVVSEEKELEYLRTVSEVIMVLLLPKGYSLSPAKGLVREVLCFKVFKEAIDEITDPDFFNRTIMAYFEKNQQASLPKKALDHVDLYIDKINDIQILQQIRANVVSKLMQATTLQNLNRAKGLDLDNEKSTQSSGILKSDINSAKRLQKTIGHLTRAKELCEKKLSSLGCVSGLNGPESGGEHIKKILSLRHILENITGRRYLSQYLQTLASHDLVRFWFAVEELRAAPESQRHQLGAEIFYTFIQNPVSEIKVDKTDRGRMESFLLGDKGPEVFVEVQRQVMLAIEEKYFHSFVISDYYKEMTGAMEKAEQALNKTDSGNEEKPLLAVVELFPGVGGGGVNLNVEDHSNYARRKLDQLEEKLGNKVQALAALKASMRPDSKVLKKLQKEVEWLQGERRQLEAHLSRTEMWSENLGKWTAIVQSAEVPDEREPPQFVLVVQMCEKNGSTAERGRNGGGGGGGEEIASGWVVCRSLAQFQELHKKLRPLCAEVKSLDLPSGISFTKFLFGKPDRATLDRAKGQIQKYLDFVLKNERLNMSEAVYAFLSPSSEHLKHSAPSPKKSRFSFATIFKTGELGLPFSLLRDASDGDVSRCLDSLDTGAVEAIDFIKTSAGGGARALKVSEDPRDTIAEPLYALLAEIFDMEGMFKYLRKTLIGFVQVTYGSNINRQIYESVAHFFSEEMLHFYVAAVLKQFWPGGRAAPDDRAERDRGDEERAETARKARANLADNVPEVLVTLVGGNAAREGANKIFDALQDRYFNKQLFYEILEVILDSIFPELH